jgi:hypothetical protein
MGTFYFYLNRAGKSTIVFVCPAANPMETFWSMPDGYGADIPKKGKAVQIYSQTGVITRAGRALH